MFYEVNNLEIAHVTWSGKIYVRKNENIQESIKRHFPKADLNSQYFVNRSTYTHVNDISAEDLKDFLNDFNNNELKA